MSFKTIVVLESEWESRDPRSYSVWPMISECAKVCELEAYYKFFSDAQSLSFDGTDDYVTVARTVSDDFTLCAWFKTTTAGNGTEHWQTMPLFDSEVQGAVGIAALRSSQRLEDVLEPFQG